MGMTDPIADMMTRLKNAGAVARPVVELPHSRFKEEVLKVLKAEGYIRDWELTEKEGRKFFRVHLKYHGKGRPAITMAAKVSTPGNRAYAGVDEIPSSNQGISVLSTPKGVMSGRKAKAQGVGGEVLFTLW
jgi:small subunit ribosomal protein S8